MTWFLAVAAVVLAVLWLISSTSRRRAGVSPRNERRDMEASTEIGVPPEALDAEESLRRDRLAGVERPKVGGSRAMGALKRRSLRKDNLSKEVELAWEAGDTIETQPGAYAWPRDFAGNEPGDIKPSRREDYALPDRYGVDRLVLMARDPQWVYAYWEVTHEKYQKMVEKRLREWGLSWPALRVYDVTYGFQPDNHLDIIVGEDADNWYIHVNKPGHTLVAEYGRVFEGEFVPFLRSNPVKLPPRSYAMEMAREWALTDWARLYGRFTPDGYASSPIRWGK